MITMVKVQTVGVRQEFLYTMKQCSAKKSKISRYDYVIKTTLGKFHMSISDGQIFGCFEEIQKARRILWCDRRTGEYNFTHADKEEVLNNFRKFIQQYVRSGRDHTKKS